MVVVKKLKLYSSHLAAALVNLYTNAFHNLWSTYVQSQVGLSWSFAKKHWVDKLCIL